MNQKAPSSPIVPAIPKVKLTPTLPGNVVPVPVEREFALELLGRDASVNGNWKPCKWELEEVPGL